MNPARVAILGFALMAVAVLAGPARAEGDGRRIALVVGNAAYKEQPLRNATNDARLIGRTLRGLGFEVEVLENTPKKAMETAILKFGERSKNASASLFYYAGHGLQVRGRNYLVPVDAAIQNEATVRVESVDVDLVLEQLGDARAAANIVILDACRNNPFERRMRGGTRGLAAVDAAVGTMIAYATAPGSTAADGDGENGLYTAELARVLALPGLAAEEVFKRVRVSVMRQSNGAQTPWESSSLTGDLVFNRGGALPAPQAAAVPPQAARPRPAPAPLAAVPPPPPPPPARASADREALFWESVKASADPGAFEEYLAQFPRGTFAGLARRRIDELRSAPAPEKQRAVAEPCPGEFDDAPAPVEVLTCHCSAASVAEDLSVWGTDIYTSDSAICVAARHAGAVGGRGGTVTLQAATGQSSYVGTTRNGVTSSSYEDWPRSFIFK
ncbi:MAG: caspase family protein [Rhodospirillales bacterium]|nr:caspase family protein [Rhodospirillales bacterium]